MAENDPPGDPGQIPTRPLFMAELAAGDQPSLFTLAAIATRALEKTGKVLLATDVLGRVHLLPAPECELPKLADEDLDPLPEEEAIRALVVQGESEDSIVAYLTRRPRPGEGS